jgi:hypothetical protein
MCSFQEYAICIQLPKIKHARASPILHLKHHRFHHCSAYCNYMTLRVMPWCLGALVRRRRAQTSDFAQASFFCLSPSSSRQKVARPLSSFIIYYFHSPSASSLFFRFHPRVFSSSITRHIVLLRLPSPPRPARRNFFSVCEPSPGPSASCRPHPCCNRAL